MSPAREFTALWALLVPFYLWMLPSGSPLAFAYVAPIAAYGFFVSPHRRADPAARASLLEVPLVFVWIMAVLWGVMPRARIPGGALLAITLGYVLFGSARRHGDTAEDWGLGSWGRTRAALAGPHGAAIRAAFVGFNVAVVASCLLAPGFASDVARGVLRRCLGVKIAEPLPAAATAAMALGLGNALLGCVRWDNLRVAARAVGLYTLGLLLVVSTAGWAYIYAWSGGWVELDPVRGLTSMLSYSIWGLLQELLFLGYFNTRIRKGMDSPLLAALWTSFVFSLFHLKAYALTAICFAIMHVWALIFMRAPNLFALAVAHGVSGGFGGLLHVKGMELIRIKGSVGPFNP